MFPYPLLTVLGAVAVAVLADDDDAPATTMHPPRRPEDPAPAPATGRKPGWFEETANDLESFLLGNPAPPTAAAIPAAVPRPTRPPGRWTFFDAEPEPEAAHLVPPVVPAEPEPEDHEAEFAPEDAGEAETEFAGADDAEAMAEDDAEAEAWAVPQDDGDAVPQDEPAPEPEADLAPEPEPWSPAPQAVAVPVPAALMPVPERPAGPVAMGRTVRLQDMREVFAQAGGRMTRKGAVAALVARGFAKSNAYRVLSAEGRFAARLAADEDGVLTWKD